MNGKIIDGIYKLGFYDKRDHSVVKAAMDVEDGVAYLVLEYHPTHDGEVPIRTTQLDIAKLQRVDWVGYEFFYNGELNVEYPK
jgi:hypothetical protein